jgi:hypothetical protein
MANCARGAEGVQILTSGTADMVCMARQLIADPEWPRNAQDNRADDIRPCVGANWCLASVMRTKLACHPQPGGRAGARELSAGALTRSRLPAASPWLAPGRPGCGPPSPRRSASIG